LTAAASVSWPASLFAPWSAHLSEQGPPQVRTRTGSAHKSQYLNVRGIVTDLGRAWTRSTVHQILINLKYIGNNVWNRSSFKLKKRRVRNDPDIWVRAEGAFEGIVDPDLFAAANAIIGERSSKLTDDEMLEGLKEVFEAHTPWFSHSLRTKRTFRPLRCVPTS
jgi:Recombinase